MSAHEKAIADLRASLAASQAEVRELREALADCEEYFADRADADAVGDPMRYVGNTEMALLGIVKRALSRPPGSDAALREVCERTGRDAWAAGWDHAMEQDPGDPTFDKDTLDCIIARILGEPKEDK